ncbi:MAG TPA: hypothetical protein VGK24_01280 [Candidatus Angelobacter sp.]
MNAKQTQVHPGNPSQGWLRRLSTVQFAQFAKRVLVFRDGKIRKDDRVQIQSRAAEVLKTLPTMED